MLHTLWSCSLFCVWGGIGCAGGAPALPWSNIGTAGASRWGPRGWVLTQMAQILHGAAASSAWRAAGAVCEEWNLWGPASTPSTQSSAPAACWTHTSCYIPSRFLCLQEWWSKPGPGVSWHPRDLGERKGLSQFCPWALARWWCAALLWWHSWVYHWSQHDHLSERSKSEKLSRLLSWITS